MLIQQAVLQYTQLRKMGVNRKQSVLAGTLLGTGSIKLVYGKIVLTASLGKRGGIPLKIAFQRLNRLGDALELIGTGQNTCAAHGAAAGNGTAGIDDLTVQRYDAEGMLEFAGNGDRAVDVIDNGGSAKKVRNGITVFCIRIDKI